MDDPRNDPPMPSRGTFLPLFLATMFAGGFLFFLVLISGGWFFYLAIVVAGFALIAGLHYLLWGWVMSQNAAGEREELELREQAEADRWPLPGPRPPRRY